MSRRLCVPSLLSNRSAQLFGTMNDQMPAGWRSCERSRSRALAFLFCENLAGKRLALSPLRLKMENLRP